MAMMARLLAALRRKRPRRIAASDLCLEALKGGKEGITAQFSSPAIPAIAKAMGEALDEIKIVNRISFGLPQCGRYGDVLFTIQRMEGRTVEQDYEDAKDRISRALAALNTAPDPASDGATKREAHAILAANRAAWAVLDEWLKPVQRRMGEEGL